MTSVKINPPPGDQKPPLPAVVGQLVERFRQNQAAYLGPYNESQVRREFIEPMFEALGWDMANRLGYAEPYKQVVYEPSVMVAGGSKTPDYSFRVGGTRKFFVEAKRPSVDLKGDGPSAFQLRRYAWSAKLPLSILTNFREFSVYDCRRQPVNTDRSPVGRVMYLTWEDYESRWQDVSSIFSPEALLKGSFDAYADSTKAKRGTSEVDNAFLTDIEDWRALLASNVALRNPGLNQREINFAVQRTLDRIIFLRICEDRGLEPYGVLQNLLHQPDIYGRLCKIFAQADDRYNSGLFQFKAESGRAERADTLTPSLTVDDKLLTSILRRLYYPDSPYEFSVIPAEILGQVYEQFLGKVIRLTAGHRAIVEDKPELRKTHGVYYTPTYVVNYIVEHTVRPLIAGKTARQVAKLRIVDPACGSGSFLIAAYQWLLDWHLVHYLELAEKKPRKEIRPTPRGTWALTTAERKRILRNNIFGVDVDSQAVEVTKLSLLLKVLEGETDETLNQQLKLFHERALPDLGKNIKSGNSLIAPDIYGYTQIDLLSEDQIYRINAFDWKDEFPSIFSTGGFDAVIGNPPYVYRNAMEEALREYYTRRYAVAEGNFELYKFFIERGASLLRPGGQLGFIVSATCLVQDSFAKLRKYLVTDTSIQRLAGLGPKVFAKATVDTAIIIVKASKPAAEQRVNIQTPRPPTNLPNSATYLVRQARFAMNSGFVIDYRLTEQGATLVRRLSSRFPAIESGYEFGVGINTGFIKGDLTARTRLDNRYHRMVPGDGISRYGAVRPKGWILYDPAYVKSRGKLGRSLPPERFFLSQKILVVRTRNLSLSRRIIATLDRTGSYNLNRLSNIVGRPGYSLLGLLAMLNSALFNWLYSTRYFDYEIKPTYLRSSPLADSNDPELIALAERMLRLHVDLMQASTDQESLIYSRDTSRVDRQIDGRVYKLYEIDEKEIELIEDQLRTFSVEPVSNQTEVATDFSEGADSATDRE